MFRSRFRPSAHACAAIALVTALLLEPVSPAAAQPVALSSADAQHVGTDVYIYGYPLVTMELTRRSFVNVAHASTTSAPMGQFANLAAYPAVDDHRVTAPNADTLYSTAWLDVSHEPYVLSVPNMSKRYFLLPMLDGWTTVFQVPGARTTGSLAHKFLIMGPDWHGTVPPGLTQYRSPTGLVWILGRIYCTGTKADYAAVHALQAKLSLVPLSAYGKPYQPPANHVNPAWVQKGSVREQVAAMSADQYFALMAELMKTNPPTRDDGPMVAEMAKMGMVPGKSWDATKLDPAAHKALASVPKIAEQHVKAFQSEGLTNVNGWHTLSITGVYHEDYVARAFVTAVGLGANRPQDAIYPYAGTDASGNKLSGANTYVVHFAKGQTPPVNGFWSVTMYTPQFFFYPNSLKKQTVGPRDKLKYNSDGSLDLYFSNKQPSKTPVSNWLPAPAGAFILMLRMYWPEHAILDGEWKVPPIHKV